MYFSTAMPFFIFPSAKYMSSDLNERRNIQMAVQQQITKDSEFFRGFEDICYAGYCGPWIEEAFMEHFFSSKVTYDRLYLPISWTNCHLKCSKEQLIDLQEFLRNLDITQKYFTVLQIDKGLHHDALNLRLPIKIDLKIFCAGGLTHGPKVTNVHIPLLKKVMEPRNLTKQYEVSFVGSNTHAVRDELKAMYESEFIFDQSQDWATLIEKSKFSLCPRGFGATSFRLFEAIQLESIPIYVWDEELLLPFKELLNWNSFSLVVHRSRIDDLHEMIAELNYEQMLRCLKQVVHFFTYEYTCLYIDSILNGETNSWVYSHMFEKRSAPVISCQEVLDERVI